MKDRLYKDIHRIAGAITGPNGRATDITKRSRRIQLIAEILKEYGFTINATRSDR